MIFFCFFLIIIIILELHHVYCNKAFILVEVPLTSNRSEPFHNTIYWENLHENSVKECQPLSYGNGIIWKINLNDFNKCGFLRSVSKWKVSVSS